MTSRTGEGHQEDSKQSLNNLKEKCPSTNVKINGNNFLCLLDTGSEVSTITSKFYNTYLSDLKLSDTRPFLKLVAANNLQIPYLGFVEVDVDLGGCVLHDVGFLVSKVNDEETTDGILGCNILKQVHNLIKDGTFKFENESEKDSWKITTTALDLSTGDDKISFVKVAGRSDICIPAKSMKVVIGSTKQNKKNKPYTAAVQAISGTFGSLPRNIMVIDTLGTIDCGKVPVRVLNIGDEDTWLKPKSRIGTLHKVDVIRSTNDEYDIDIQETEVVIRKISTKTSDDIPISDDYNDHLKVKMGDVILTEDQKGKFDSLLRKHRETFSKDDNDLGYTEAVKHAIKLKDDVPIRLPHRRIPPHQIDEVKQHIKKLLDSGVIRKSSSPFASAVVIVRKKDKSLRLCVDYRELNKKTIKDAYPLPRIDETLDVLHGAKYFSSIDLAQGYHQVAMDEESIEKTAFRVGTGGLYEYLRMPFGLCNSPATFQRLMEACFSEENFEILLLYLDDILVFSNTVDEHLRRLDIVFTKLKSHGLKMKPTKCSFFNTSVKYLGHVVSEKGISTDPEKTEAIKSWPTPTTEKELRSFLGLAGYYRRFVKDFSKIARPLHSLTHNNKSGQKKITKPFQESWTTECDSSFNALKEKLISSPILGYPDFKKTFILETDASFDGLGAVLSQEQQHGHVVIAYASRTLRPTERNMENYSSMKLELLALKWAVTEKFRDYLLGAKFVVYTDNNPLSYLQTAKLGATETRWASQLAQFDFEVKFRSGKVNRNADALSRKPVPKIRTVTCNSESVLQTITKGSTLMDIRRKDTEISHAHVRFMQTETVDATNTLPEYEHTEIASLQTSDPLLSRVRYWIKNDVKPTIEDLKRENKNVRKLLKHMDKLQIEEDVIYRYTDGETGPCRQVLLPTSLKQHVLESLHSHAGHQGVERTLSLVQKRCYWVTMKNDVEEFCKKCERCLISKAPLPSVKPPIGNLLAFKPLDILAIDFTLLEPASDGRENVLVMTDIFSKFTQAVPTRDQKATTVAKVLTKEWFFRYGIPRRIHSDQGRNFESAIIQELCKIYNISKSRTTPYHPEGNGQVERYNRTMHNLLRTLTAEQKRKWPEYLPELVYVYNSTIHSSTGYTPYFLMFCREPTLPIDHFLGLGDDNSSATVDEYIVKHKQRMSHVMEQAKKNLEDNAKRRNKHYNRSTKQSEIAIGSRILLRKRVIGRSKIQDTWDSTPYRVVGAPGDNVYTIQIVDGSGPTRNVTRREILDTGEIVYSEDDSDSTISDSDSESENRVFILKNVQNCDPASDNDVEETELSLPDTSVAPSVQPRRTTRSTAGKHSNLHHLPTSAIRSQTVTEDVHDFQQLSQAVANLGASLASTLTQAWAQYKH